MAKKTTKKKNFKSKTIRAIRPIRKAEDIPVTQGMLLETQKILASMIKAVDRRVISHDKKFKSIDLKFDSIDKRFESIDKRFEALEMKMDSRFDKVESSFQDFKSEMHRWAVIFEEQNARNKIVLEGYEQLYHRQDRLEAKVDERLSNIEAVVFNKVSDK